jgi:hypothetical protein
MRLPAFKYLIVRTLFLAETPIFSYAVWVWTSCPMC